MRKQAAWACSMPTRLAIDAMEGGELVLVAEHVIATVAESVSSLYTG